MEIVTKAVLAEMILHRAGLLAGIGNNFVSARSYHPSIPLPVYPSILASAKCLLGSGPQSPDSLVSFQLR